MAVTIIVASASGGLLTVDITSPEFPHPLTGVVWRFDSAGTPIGDEPIGEFTPKVNTVELGKIADIKTNSFLIEGAVLETGDDPPTPYRVFVTVHQDGKDLKREVPADNGSGQIGKDDIRFSYPFTIKVKK
ncbi:MAG: hypothetical protein M3081_02550 [Gemmatimonadota bacterium]|nr:hypothetical protein [Gemmatimonadota bacterium]